mmetsp:Transcript_54459/g.65554  ORF Transcript_54459/g.65554 Transcript_54459/m.65554 type:complete len:432 (+) Transcript_54459:76-1371(+)
MSFLKMMALIRSKVMHSLRSKVKHSKLMHSKFMQSKVMHSNGVRRSQVQSSIFFLLLAIFSLYIAFRIPHHIDENTSSTRNTIDKYNENAIVGLEKKLEEKDEIIEALQDQVDQQMNQQLLFEKDHSNGKLTTELRRKKENTGTKRKITRISLLGERNSGTTWMSNHLIECFNSTNLSVRNTLTRYKHWFQDESIDANKHQETLVIAQFRDVYQWVEAMRSKPHQAPMHWNIHEKRKLGWEDFLTKSWTMPRTRKDMEYLRHNFEKGINSTSMIECHRTFSYNEINACLKDPFDEKEYKLYKDDGAGAGLTEPRYEFVPDGSGRAFQSIIDMRAAKIENFLSVVDYEFVSQLLVVRYEDALAKGTEFVIREIEELTGVKATCQPNAAQPERPGRELPYAQIEWMNKYVKWETEHKIGYTQLEPEIQKVEML